MQRVLSTVQAAARALRLPPRLGRTALPRRGRAEPPPSLARTVPRLRVQQSVAVATPAGRSLLDRRAGVLLPPEGAGGFLCRLAKESRSWGTAVASEGGEDE